MQNKIKKLMESESLSTTRFAELLGVQPSGVSHILSGRNKPSFELLQRILRRFPRVNPDWLLLDSEQIYRDNMALNKHSETHYSRDDNSSDRILDLFIEPVLDTKSPKHIDIATIPTAPMHKPAAQHSSPSTQQNTPTPTAEKNIANCAKAEVERIVIFYSDGTFTCYHAKK